MTGERAEMSKDRRYESKDSREMLKGSFSLKTLRLVVLVVLRDELVVQKLFRSGGEGGMKTPLSLISDEITVSLAYDFECRGAWACRLACTRPDLFP